VADQLTIGRGVCVPFQRVGDICNGDDDCDPTVQQIYCAKKDFTCRVRGKQNEACAYSPGLSAHEVTLPMLLECDSTQKNLFCDPVTAQCKPLPQANQPCVDPLPPGVTSACDPDASLHLVCDTAASTNGGICRAPGKLGDDCSNFLCDKGLYCDHTSFAVCKTLPTLNQQCSAAGSCLDPYFCNFGKSPAVCDQPARLGQSCTQVTCDTGLYCDRSNISNEVCAPQLPDGSFCTSTEQCLSSLCGLSGTSSSRTCLPQQTGVQCIGR
jgi:hypothetical protein